MLEYITGLAFVVSGILIYRRSRRLLRNGRRAAGQVVGREWVPGRDGGNYFAVIQFHTADGQEVRIRGPAGGLPVRVGKHVRVIYDPGNPRNGAVDSFLGRGEAMAVVCALVGLWIIGFHTFQVVR